METDSYVYDAFGAVTSSTGTTSNDWLFTGEQRKEGGISLSYFEYSRDSAGDLSTCGFDVDCLRRMNRFEAEARGLAP